MRQVDPLLIVPDTAVLKLDDLGLYRVGFAYRGMPEREFPTGWSGAFDEQTGVACLPVGVQNDRQALLLHCPWRNGTGIAFQEFHIQIPRAGHVMLRGATALRADGVGKSDGVTFRIMAGSRKLLDVHRTDAAWQDFAYDLSGAAGTVMVLRFETDPGPKDDSSFDFGLWGDRRLVFEGFRGQTTASLVPPCSRTSLPGLSARPGHRPASSNSLHFPVGTERRSRSFFAMRVTTEPWSIAGIDRHPVRRRMSRWDFLAGSS